MLAHWSLLTIIFVLESVFLAYRRYIGLLNNTSNSLCVFFFIVVLQFLGSENRLWGFFISIQMHIQENSVT